jgi:HEAT repeat protein
MRFSLTLLSLFALCALSPVWAKDTAGQSKKEKKEKISTIRSAGKRDSQAIATLSPYLSDSDTDVRDEAVKAIINIGTQRSLDPLIKATHDNNADIQIRATNGLVNFYLPGYVTTGGLTSTFTRVSKRIKDSFSDRNDDVIAPGVSVRPDVIAALADLVSGGASIDSRSNAARAVGILRGHDALPALQKALRSKDTGLIYESLVAIQKIGDTSVGPDVIFLANDFDALVQSTALETLGILHVTDAAPQVRQAVNRPHGDRVHRAALEALSMLALPEDRELFISYKDSKDSELRTSALEGLGRIRDPQDYPILESAFNKESELKPRLGAAFALVCQGKVDTADFSPLRYLVNGLNLAKGNSAAEVYLEELSRKAEVRKALLPLLATATKQEKLGLIKALAPNADAETASALQQLTRDSDYEVSLAATRSQMIKAH